MRAYLLRLTAAAILGALLRKLAPKNGAGQATRLGAGLLILLVALKPLAEADLTGAALELGRLGTSDVLSTEPLDVTANSLLAGLIRDGAESYILDKADTLGLSLRAEVETEMSESYPVPWSVRLYGEPTEPQRAALSKALEEELGIPAARQEWIDM